MYTGWFYLKEDNIVVKDSFVEVADTINSISSFSSIADVGCATGAFPNYLKQRFSKADVVGIEVEDKFLAKAKSDFPEIVFIKGDVTKKDSITRKFDVITMIGVLCIFDKFELVLENVLSWLNPKGRLILNSMVSDYDLDIFTKFSKSNDKFDSTKLESGWNIISEKSLKIVAEKNNARIISSKIFNIKTKLNKHKDDPIRSWTEENINGGKDIYNGLHIRQPIKTICIQKY